MLCGLVFEKYGVSSMINEHKESAPNIEIQIRGVTLSTMNFSFGCNIIKRIASMNGDSTIMEINANKNLFLGIFFFLIKLIKFF